MDGLYNYEAEQGVLGGSLLDPKRWDLVSDMITGEDFSHPPFGVIFEAIKSIRNSGKPIDLLVLKNELTRREQFDYIGGNAGISSLTDSVPTGAHVEYYGQIVLEKSQLRKLLYTAEELISNAKGKGATPDDVIERVESALFAISTRGAGDCTKHISELIRDQTEAIFTQQETGKVAFGLTTGYDAMDEITNGFHPNEFIVIAGRPSMGKTTYALNILRRQAMQGNPVAFFSLEMGDRNLTSNLTAAQGQINGNVMRKMSHSKDELARLVRGSEELSNMPIYIDDTPGLTLNQFRSRTRRLVSKHGIKAAYIDYIQLMLLSNNGKSMNREQEVSTISRTLKLTAKELGIPIIALAQLGRRCEERKDHRPVISDLRESGSIEQDADMVILIHRPEKYNPEDRPGIMEAIIGKQRNGATGTVDHTPHFNQLRIENHVDNVLATGYAPTGEEF